MTAVGLVGASGFVGSAVNEAVTSSGFDCVPLPRVSVPDVTPGSPAELAEAIAADASKVEADNAELLSLLRSVRGVINAAGLAAPTEQNRIPLWQTNVVLPAVIEHLCSVAEVGHFVHVSSAAVQSDMNPLNDESVWRAHTPYAESKVLAERFLLDHARVPTAIYRATSVVGPNRKIVDSLFRLYSGRVAPVFGDGSAELPLSALPNTAGAIATLSNERATGVFLQPWEGATQGRVAAALAGERTRLLRIPVPAMVRRLRGRTSGYGGPLAAQLRRADLLVFGQAQDGTRLLSEGYTDRVDFLDYISELAHSTA